MIIYRNYPEDFLVKKKNRKHQRVNGSSVLNPRHDVTYNKDRHTYAYTHKHPVLCTVHLSSPNPPPPLPWRPVKRRPIKNVFFKKKKREKKSY